MSDASNVSDLSTGTYQPGKAGFLVPLIGLILILMSAVGMQVLFGLPLWAQFGLVAVVGLLLAHLVLSIVMHFHNAELDDNDAVGAAFGTVAAIFALLFGFVVMVTWQARSKAETAISHETNALSEIRRLSAGFDPSIQRQVEATTQRYARVVLEREWPQLMNGEQADAAEPALAALWKIYTDMGPEARSSGLYTQSVSRLDDLSVARRTRIQAAGPAIAPTVNLLLYAAGTLTVFLAYFYRVSTQRLQRLLLTLMATLMLLTLFGLSIFDEPYDPRFPTESNSFEQLR